MIRVEVKDFSAEVSVLGLFLPYYLYHHHQQQHHHPAPRTITALLQNV
jgi:hypothetical protein